MFKLFLVKEKTKASIVLILICTMQSICMAQSPLNDAINNNLIEISNSPNNNIKNFEKYSKVFANIKILALGEETHGIKEFMEFRGALIKKLVTDLNYKVIILEADFSGSQILNDYVLYGKGDKYQALLSLGIGIWRNQEFLDIIEWLQRYNTNKPLPERVRIYGADMQMTLTAAYISTGKVQLKKNLSAEAKKGLVIMRQIGSKVSKSDKRILQKLSSELNEEILEYPDSSFFRQSLITVLQSLNWFLSENRYQQGKIRDKFMAENIDWIYTHELNKKTIFMSHNIHLAKHPIYNDIKRAGNYLKEKYKDEYYSLGFSFYSGNFLAGDEKGGYERKVFNMPAFKNKKSSEYIFSQCEKPNFFLDFKSNLRNANINLFLTNKTFSKNIGASYHLSNKEIKPTYMPLYDKFDGIVFIKKVSPISLPFAWDKKE